MFFECCISPNLDASIKKHIVLIFESLLMIYQNVEMNPDTLKTFYEKLFSETLMYIKD